MASMNRGGQREERKAERDGRNKYAGKNEIGKSRSCRRTGDTYV